MTDKERELRLYMETAHHPQVNSILMWENGRIAAEIYFNGFNSSDRHPIKSVVKSIMSIATGIAEDLGLLNIDDPICKYIPEFSEGRDIQHKRIRIRHLLTMTSGIFWQGGVHYHSPGLTNMKRSGKWIDYIADCRVTDVPGTKYNYKEWDVILLAAVLNAACGDCFDFINEKLYKPLGITSERWFKSPDGVYYSVAIDEEKEKLSNLCARDLLKLGIMLYQDGMYEGKQIVLRKYIEKAITPGVSTSNYGFLFWIEEDNYAMKGYGGQNVVVFPKLGKIVVTQATPTSRPLIYPDLVRFGSEL